MTEKEIAQYGLSALKKAGADKAICSVSRGSKDEFNVENGDFSLLRTTFTDQLYLKALKDNKKGILAINQLDSASIDKAAEDCIALAKAAQPEPAEDIAEKGENKNFDQAIGGADMAKLFSRSKDFLEQLCTEFPTIKMNLITDFNSAKKSFVNSNGVEYNSTSEYYHVHSMFSAKDGQKTSSFNGYGAALSNLDKSFIDLDMHRTLLNESVQSLDARQIDEKFVGNVIVTPACGDVIWGTLINVFLSDYSLISGTSRWKDALGTQVADSKLTMRAAPLHPQIVCGERYTADGYESRDMDFIKDGILQAYALSLYGSRKTNKPRALNTAFRTIEVAAGKNSYSDMIKGVKRGILLNRFSGAQPGPSGDISGVAKNSFLIEDGEIKGALKETMISFNIVDLLKNIISISSERVVDGSSILPWCCFDGVTVSGN